MAPWPQLAPQHPQHPLTGSALHCSVVGLEPSRSSLQAGARAPRRFAEVRQRRFAEWVAGLQAPLTCARRARAWPPERGRSAAANSAEAVSRVPAHPGPMALWSPWARWHPVPLPWKARPSPGAAVNWLVAPQLGRCPCVNRLAQALPHRPHQVPSSTALHRAPFPQAPSSRALHRRQWPGEKASSSQECSASGMTVPGTVARGTRAG
jgi:hypothetical protein